jgi:hypothetical protein
VLNKNDAVSGLDQTIDVGDTFLLLAAGRFEDTVLHIHHHDNAFIRHDLLRNCL